jgi:hypothetical protein
MHKAMKYLLMILLAGLPVLPLLADEKSNTPSDSVVTPHFDALKAFNAKYATYLRAESQTPLPLPEIAKTDWPRLSAGLGLRKIFVEPDRFYLAKVYTFTLYQAADGRYYLDVKGGFWGMDQLYYGPFDEADLK